MHIRCSNVFGFQSGSGVGFQSLDLPDLPIFKCFDVNTPLLEEQREPCNSTSTYCVYLTRESVFHHSDEQPKERLLKQLVAENVFFLLILFYLM